mmetsp:Transcript_81958/g.232039  ORF Transcript_81958/g.232039 Transcript_81958/m.232039 type:complete len:267 (+) Transcript_81958:671-1471(+)
MVPEGICKLVLVLRNLCVKTSGPDRHVCGQLQGLALTTPARLGLPQAVQLQLRLADGSPELLLFHLSVEELVHNVHNICEACHFPNLLEAVLCLLAVFKLLEGNLLQAVASELLNRIDLPITPSRCLEGLVRCLHCHVIAPAFEVLTVPDVVLPEPRSGLEVLNCNIAQLALCFDLLLHCLELVDASDLLLVKTATAVLLPVYLRGLSPQVLLHDLHLVLHYVELAIEPRNHVLIHMVQLNSLVDIGSHLVHLFSEGISGRSAPVV